MTARIVTLSLLASLAVLLPAAQGAARPTTTEPTEIVDYNVTLRDSGITVSPNVGLRGTAGRFIVRNFGKKLHSFTVGNDKVVSLYKAGLSTGMIKPRSRARILLLFFDYRGKLTYRSIAPADRSNPRMKGFFTIN
jgi:FtsP/CotA-like multicopper oxidase with cupredoxin domain